MKNVTKYSQEVTPHAEWTCDDFQEQHVFYIERKPAKSIRPGKGYRDPEKDGSAELYLKAHTKILLEVEIVMEILIVAFSHLEEKTQ